MSSPKIVCLIGSTRFMDTFVEAARLETLKGKIVLTVHCGKEVGEGTETKKKLDALHLHKIDMADDVLVINVGGYIGDGTKRELAYAKAQDKEIRWWE